MSEPFVVVDVDEGLERILRSLQKLPDQLAAPQVLQKALNTTARKARTRLIKEAGKRYALSKPEALKTESKVEASTSDTSAAIISKGSMRDIMDFLTQPNSDTAAAAAQVLNSGSIPWFTSARPFPALPTTAQHTSMACLPRLRMQSVKPPCCGSFWLRPAPARMHRRRSPSRVAVSIRFIRPCRLSSARRE